MFVKSFEMKSLEEQVYSTGLKPRDTDGPVIAAGIQSICFLIPGNVR